MHAWIHVSAIDTPNTHKCMYTCMRKYIAMPNMADSDSDIYGYRVGRHDNVLSSLLHEVPDSCVVPPCIGRVVQAGAARLYSCMYVCKYVCIYIYIYICMYIYIILPRCRTFTHIYIYTYHDIYTYIYYVCGFVQKQVLPMCIYTIYKYMYVFC
jgi:hypothetical protein